MAKKEMTMTEDLIKHIKKQTEDYKLLENNLAIDDSEIFRLNVRVEEGLYTKYKVQLILNHTTPTADIRRYIFHTIENNKI